MTSFAIRDIVPDHGLAVASTIEQASDPAVAAGVDVVVLSVDMAGFPRITANFITGSARGAEALPALAAQGGIRMKASQHYAPKDATLWVLDTPLPEGARQALFCGLALEALAQAADPEMSAGVVMPATLFAQLPPAIRKDEAMTKGWPVSPPAVWQIARSRMHRPAQCLRRKIWSHA